MGRVHVHHDQALHVFGEDIDALELSNRVPQRRNVALRIRQLAKDNGVPIVENPPLARALHATVDLDSAIEPEHYKAVAEILAYFDTLSNWGRWGGEDRLGTLNYVTPDVTVAAASERKRSIESRY